MAQHVNRDAFVPSGTNKHTAIPMFGLVSTHSLLLTQIDDHAIPPVAYPTTHPPGLPRRRCFIGMISAQHWKAYHRSKLVQGGRWRRVATLLPIHDCLRVICSDVTAICQMGVTIRLANISLAFLFFGVNEELDRCS